MRRIVTIAALLSLAAGPVMAAEASRAPALAPGVVLVANPSLDDPNFRRTVVIICDHRPEGTMGLILNRTTTVLLSEALPEEAIFKGTTYMVYAGGPVQPNALLMLFRTSEPPSDARKIMDGVFLGGDMPTVVRMITKPQPSETFRTFAGYAGWGPGQLEFEVSMGSWAPLAGTPAMLFETEPDRLWPELIDALRAPGSVSLPTPSALSLTPSENRH